MCNNKKPKEKIIKYIKYLMNIVVSYKLIIIILPYIITPFIEPETTKQNKHFETIMIVLPPEYLD